MQQQKNSPKQNEAAAFKYWYIILKFNISSKALVLPYIVVIGLYVTIK